MGAAGLVSDVKLDNVVVASSPPIPSLREFFTADPDQFVAKYTDIAAVNMACAIGLTGAEDLEHNIRHYLEVLDEMAAATLKRIESSWRLFKLKPHAFKDSEDVFRVLMMEHVLTVRFYVRYDPAVSALALENKHWYTTDSSEVFAHGILKQLQVP